MALFLMSASVPYGRLSVENPKVTFCKVKNDDCPELLKSYGSPSQIRFFVTTFFLSY